MQWNVYYTLDQINSWLDSLVATHRNVASIVKGGESYEKRDIRGIRISHGTGKRAIFIEAGIHSREWISPASACYLINELLNSQNSDIRAAARDFDWYIFPIFNPDGYVWSHEQVLRQNIFIKNIVCFFISSLYLNKNYNFSSACGVKTDVLLAIISV